MGNLNKKLHELNNIKSVNDLTNYITTQKNKGIQYINIELLLTLLNKIKS